MTRRLMTRLFGLSFLALSAGCRSPAPPPGLSPALSTSPPIVGRVLRVNPRWAFVIVRCESLPLPGEELTIYRQRQDIGRVRVTEPVRYPFAVADLLTGEPRRGDVVRRASGPQDETGADEE